MNPINLIIGFFRNTWRKYNGWRFSNKVALPVIKEVYPTFSMKDFASVQPMIEPSSSFIKMKVIDSRNPEIGEIYTDCFKVKGEYHRCGCISPHWYKIYTDTGWIYERTQPEEFKKQVEKYYDNKKLKGVSK